MKNIKKRYIISFLGFAVLIAVMLIFFRHEIYRLMRLLFDVGLSAEAKRDILGGIFDVKEGAIIAFVAACQIALPFFPAEPIQVIAGIGYGFWTACGIIFAGVLVGNTIVFLSSRLFGGRITRYFNDKIEIDLNSPAAQGRVFLLVLILYILPAIPYGMICFLTASTGMRYGKYIAITGLCSLPSVFIGVGLGSTAVGCSPVVSLAVLGVLLICIGVIAARREAIFGLINRRINQPSNPYSRGARVRKPRRLLYALCRTGCDVAFRPKLKITCLDRIKDMEGPAVVISNHPSFIDWYYVSRVFSSRRLNFITARYYFYNKALGWVLHQIGALPKSMFSPDTESAANSFRVVRSGGVLALLPEARLSTVGRYEPIHPSTAKMIKKLDCPVYAVHIDGAYLAKPKWGKGFRRGAPVEVRARQILTPEELDGMTPDEILEVLEKSLRYNDFEWLAQRPQARYECPDMAEGLENILYLCPKCKEEMGLTASGRRITCRCGCTAELDDRYGFVSQDVGFANLQQWYDWQWEQLKRQVEDESFEMRAKVTLKLPTKHGREMFYAAGAGECVLNKDGLAYTGTMDGQPAEMHFKMSTIYRLLFGAGENFEIYSRGQYYYFAPEDPRECVKWYIASEHLCNKYNGEPTPARQ